MHADYTLLMSLALDDEATAAETHRLQEHLRGCGECAALWERWQALDHRFSVAPAAAPPADLAVRVAARLEAHELRRRDMHRFGSGLLAGWLAVVVLGVVAGALLTIWGAHHPAEARLALAGSLKLVEGASWLVFSLLVWAGRLGAPTVAAGFGIVATLTCALGMLWLWVVGHSQNWLRQAAPLGD